MNKLKKQILHLSIDGFPGVGKTGILIALLAACYRVHFMPRYTTRPRRPGEENSPEYIFVSKRKFAALKKAGFFMKRSLLRSEVNGKFYPRGIPKKKYWPEPPEGTELIISFFGRSMFFIRGFVPEMKLVFISHSSVNRSLAEVKLRVSARCRKHGIDELPKLQAINRIYTKKAWLKYDFVIFNDSTAYYCAKDIIRLSGQIQKRSMSGLIEV